MVKETKMKTLAIILALTATTATAADFPLLGQTVSIGAESDTNYTTGVEDWEWELTPYAGVNLMGVGLTLETDIDMLKLNEDEIFTGVDVELNYSVPHTNVNLYTEVSSDKDFDFGDVTIGATVKF
jgi:opacity protein-like surface antigen